MADDVQLNQASGTAGDVIAADEISGVKHQRVKVQFGDDGSATDASRLAPFPVGLGNIASTSNTTTSTLAGDATYTGTAEVAPADGVVVSCYADVAGTLYFDFSVNGTDWRTFPSNGFAVSAAVHEYHSAKVNGRYFRVRFVNGSSAQSTFQLYTYFGPHTHPSAPLNQTLGSDADAMVVRPTNPDIDEGLGRLGGIQRRRKFGYTTGLSSTIVIGTSSTWVSLWRSGGIRTVPSSSFTPYIASTSASDTDVDVTFEYIDTDGYRQTASVNLDGQTPVSGGVTALESFRAWVSGGTAAVGTIHCASANNFSSGVPSNQNERLWSAPVNDNQTQLLAERVQTGKQLLLESLRIAIARDNAGTTSIIAVFQVRLSGGVWRTFEPIIATSSVASEIDMRGITLAAGTDYRVVIRDVGTNGTSIKGTLVYHEVDA